VSIAEMRREVRDYIAAKGDVPNLGWYCSAVSALRSPASGAVQRGLSRSTIFEQHFEEFCNIYDERYATTYGMFRLDRIRDIGERFLTCGDYRRGVARIRCTTPRAGTTISVRFPAKASIFVRRAVRNVRCYSRNTSPTKSFLIFRIVSSCSRCRRCFARSSVMTGASLPRFRD